MTKIVVDLSTGEVAAGVPYTAEELAAIAFYAAQAPNYDELVRRIERQFEAEIAAIKAGYTPDEISSWPYQVAEASAWEANSGAVTPLIDAILVTRGGTKPELVARILANSAAYAAAFGEALGRKQAAIAALTVE